MIINPADSKEVLNNVDEKKKNEHLLYGDKTQEERQNESKKYKENKLLEEK